MNRTVALIVLLVIALLATGCGGGEPSWVKVERTRRADAERAGIVCNDLTDNTSGNICRVRVGDQECVAVLPDGGKAPKDYKDFVTCPGGGRR